MIWSMADGQAKLMQLAIEKAESELRTQQNQEHCSVLAIQITNIRLEQSKNELEASKLMLQHYQNVEDIKKLPKIKNGDFQ